MKRISIFGSTGSIGTSTLKVVSDYPDKLSVYALVAGTNVRLLAEQVSNYQPEIAVLASAEPDDTLISACKNVDCELLLGQEGISHLAMDATPDIAVAAMMGAAGIDSTIKAIEAGVDIALANKEVMVAAGEIVTHLAIKHEVMILPVDSEHNAIFQCLAGEKLEEVERIILCASGGPFLNKPIQELENVTPAQALKHPRWSMGQKISIDSATMMNKGLEMIEARWLFGLKPEQVSVVIHPQSIAHSMVEFIDGSVIAQLGVTDMVMPIQHSLSYPQRWPNKQMKLDLPKVEKLDFFEPDEQQFPSLNLARQAMAESGSMPTVLNAANEIAVDSFLKGNIGFTDIVKIVATVMDQHSTEEVKTLAEIMEIDKRARQQADALIIR